MQPFAEVRAIEVPEGAVFGEERGGMLIEPSLLEGGRRLQLQVEHRVAVLPDER